LGVEIVAMNAQGQSALINETADFGDDSGQLIAS
jgi:hypothetical protein